MPSEGRKRRRRPIDCEVVVSWQDHQGARFVRARGVDLSETGVRIEGEEPLSPGARVFVRAPDYGLGGMAYVRHCVKRGAKYVVGLDLSEDRVDAGPDVSDAPEDCYEVLQISSTAEMETIHRVYKMLAARYHPDNLHTGDAEKFLRLGQAYQILSDPEKRAAHDSQRQHRSFKPLPVFKLKEFVTGVDAEANRRLGILSLLYKRRMADPDQPGLTMLDLESLMAIPREHLEFTVWFLKEKQYLRVGHTSESDITAAGVEFVEASLPVKSILQKLLLAAQDETPNGPPERGGARM